MRPLFTKPAEPSESSGTRLRNRHTTLPLKTFYLSNCHNILQNIYRQNITAAILDAFFLFQKIFILLICNMNFKVKVFI